MPRKKTELDAVLRKIRKKVLHDRYLIFSTFRNDVVSAGLTLEDLGTSEEELKQISDEGNRRTAWKLLQGLRAVVREGGELHIGDLITTQVSLEQYMMYGGWSPEDLRTSAEELESFNSIPTWTYTTLDTSPAV